MNNIKIVKRFGVFETNSSSSHSVCIDMSEKNFMNPDSPYWDLDIRDGILYIPGKCIEFGWNFFKTNSCTTKLQYLVGFFCRDIKSISGHKRINNFKMLLKSIFGVSDVKIECVDDYFSQVKNELDKNKKLVIDDYYVDTHYFPNTIDHQSCDLIFEIYENKDTLRTFLLSPNSWLYGGNDNSYTPHGFYSEKYAENNNTIISIDFPKIGRYDIEASLLHLDDENDTYYGSNYRDIYSVITESDDGLINSTFWNPNKDEIIFNNDELRILNFSTPFSKAELPDGISEDFFKYKAILNRSGNLFLVYLKIKDILDHSGLGGKDAGTTITVDSIFSINDQYFSDPNKEFFYSDLLLYNKYIDKFSYIFNKLVGAGKLKETDYKLFPVHITDKEILGDNIL